MEQWRQEAEAQMVADEAGTAGGRAHGTRGDRRGAAEVEWVESQGGTAAAAALAGAAPTLSELLLSSLVEEAPPGSDKPQPLHRSLTHPIPGEKGTPVIKPPRDMLKGVKAPKGIERHLQAALADIGIIDRNWAGPRPVQELENDEICADLRQMTSLLDGIMKRNEATVARLIDETSQAGATRKTESELSGPSAKEIEDRYLKRKRAQKQRKKSKKKKVQGGTRTHMQASCSCCHRSCCCSALHNWCIRRARCRSAVRVRIMCLVRSGCLSIRWLVAGWLAGWLAASIGPKKNQSLGTSAIQALASGKTDGGAAAGDTSGDAAAAPAAAAQGGDDADADADASTGAAAAGGAAAATGGGDPAFSSEGRGLG